MASYAIASWLFLRLLGLAYVFAFLSLGLQIPGLIGADGIVPASEYLADAAEWADASGIGVDRYRLLPTLAWLASSDRALQAMAFGGAALAGLVCAGITPILILPVLWILYLSLATVSGDFLSFQWDALLLEAGLLAMFLAPAAWRHRLRDAADPPRVARWLVWWLLFRLMLGSGIVKLASGDPTWRDLTALAVHYETQPLPTPIAWYAAVLPLWFHRLTTALVLGVELVVPCLMVGRLRRIAALVLIALQALIALTGNYAFFNLLTIALALMLLDDGALGVLRRAVPPARVSQDARWRAWAAAGAALVIVPASVAVFATQFRIVLPPARPLAEAVAPFRSVNRYGLFAVMTTERLEIEVEGSADGATWRSYEFRHKPGPLARRPSWVAPFQPRLDWQMWFAALGRYEEEIWFQRFCRKLLEGSPAVTALLETDPFEGTRPRFVRATLYRYRFTDWRTGRESGDWWKRERLREYGPNLEPRTPNPEP